MKLYKLWAFFCLLQSANLHAQVKSNASDSTLSDGKVFTEVEMEAGFTGGEEGWRTFLMKNLNPNVPVDNDAPAGKYTVVVKFVVSADGSLSNIAAETNIGYGMEKEVVRLMQKSGKWAPAIKDGKPINAYRRQPVTFLVEGDFDIKTDVPYTLFANTDNIISLQIRKVKVSNLTLTISQGTITAIDGDKFLVKLNKPGRAIITVYETKKDKMLGAMSFAVLPKQ